jgi:predicted nucleic acid-binding protein
VIVLDTNVISELTKIRPAPAVVEWFDSSTSGELWLTSISLAEILYGIERLPAGTRKAQLANTYVEVIGRAFKSRILAFDESAASLYALIVVHRQSGGRPISVQDAQIAAICRSTGASLATRNIRDFEHTGVQLINPWEYQPE